MCTVCNKLHYARGTLPQVAMAAIQMMQDESPFILVEDEAHVAATDIDIADWFRERGLNINEFTWDKVTLEGRQGS